MPQTLGISSVPQHCQIHTPQASLARQLPCKMGSEEKNITKYSLKVNLACPSGSCILYSILNIQEKPWFAIKSMINPTTYYVLTQKR